MSKKAKVEEEVNSSELIDIEFDAYPPSERFRNGIQFLLKQFDFIKSLKSESEDVVEKLTDLMIEQHPIGSVIIEADDDDADQNIDEDISVFALLTVVPLEDTRLDSVFNLFCVNKSAPRSDCCLLINLRVPGLPVDYMLLSLKDLLSDLNDRPFKYWILFEDQCDFSEDNFENVCYDRWTIKGSTSRVMVFEASTVENRIVKSLEKSIKK
ncbi:hypothetical protein ACOME3_010791 [Neoechinorhynchus agilis]